MTDFSARLENEFPWVRSMSTDAKLNPPAKEANYKIVIVVQPGVVLEEKQMQDLQKAYIDDVEINTKKLPKRNRLPDDFTTNYTFNYYAYSEEIESGITVKMEDKE